MVMGWPWNGNAVIWKQSTELRAALDQDSALTPGEVRSAKVPELFALFDEDHIPQILEECGDVL